MMICNHTKTKKEFDTFDYQSVVWSGDQLPICPYCRESIYDKDFNKNHPNKNNLDEVSPYVIPKFDSPKNWTEDYQQENGNYLCKCSKCKQYFYGHKRRPLCKECIAPSEQGD